MIGHVYISVTDIERSLTFYLNALEPLGWRQIGSYSAAGGPHNVPDLHGIGDEAYISGGVRSSVWLRQRVPGETGLYLGIMCESNEDVEAAYVAGISAGGLDDGKPSDRTYFAPGYYAANVADADAIAWSSCTRPGTRRCSTGLSGVVAGWGNGPLENGARQWESSRTNFRPSWPVTKLPTTGMTSRPLSRVSRRTPWSTTKIMTGPAANGSSIELQPARFRILIV
jgi:hypothetical protein